jgi:hypothetical protein
MVVGSLLDIVDDEWRSDTLPEDGAWVQGARCSVQALGYRMWV